MDTKKNTPEHLPSGVLQAIIFCVEEVRDHLRRGKQSTANQIVQANHLPAKERSAIMPGLQNQMEYFKRCEGTLDYFLTRVHQKMRWPAIVRNMIEKELKESHIDMSLWDVMQWNKEKEPQVV